MGIKQNSIKEQNDLKVTVLCTTFNQKDYIKDCLDGIVKQNTNFRFLVIVHDDCSTDGTKEIVEDYAKKYPDIIKPIFEKENQYSRGVDILEEILYPKVKSKYVAYCEGDDYWTDENKLQIQYNEMEKNPKASACVHNTKKIFVDSNRRVLFNKCNYKKKMTPKEIIYDWNIQTSSFFVRAQSCRLKEFCQEHWCTDYPLMLGALLDGDIIYLPEVMSVYRAHTKGGVAFKPMDWEKVKERSLQMIGLLDRFNKYSGYKYDYAVDMYKGSMLHNVARARYRKQKFTRKEFYNIKQELYSNDSFNNHRAQLSLFRKVKTFFQTRIFFTNRIMYFIYKQRYFK